jgi:hypothetical protein
MVVVVAVVMVVSDLAACPCCWVVPAGQVWGSTAVQRYSRAVLTSCPTAGWDLPAPGCSTRRSG